MNPEKPASIAESFFELRQVFSEPWVERWIPPAPFVLPLLRGLRNGGVELTDFVFNKEASSVGENYLNVSIRKLNAAVRISLNTITFIAANPNWAIAPELARVFDQASEIFCGLVDATPASQKSTLALHVSPGAVDFREKTRHLISMDLAGDALFCGISVHRMDRTLVIDKSLKYDGAAYVRLERSFSGDTAIADIASSLYEDEVAALHLLGIPGVP